MSSTGNGANEGLQENRPVASVRAQEILANFRLKCGKMNQTKRGMLRRQWRMLDCSVSYVIKRRGMR